MRSSCSASFVRRPGSRRESPGVTAAQQHKHNHATTPLTGCGRMRRSRYPIIGLHHQELHPSSGCRRVGSPPASYQFMQIRSISVALWRVQVLFPTEETMDSSGVAALSQ